MINLAKRVNDNTAFYEKDILKNIFSWKELETLLNLRPFISSSRFNFISKDYHMWPNQAWLSDNNTWPASKLNEVINSCVCYLTDCSRVNKEINDVCSIIEKETGYPTDAHIYFSLVDDEDKKKGFEHHWDYSHNLILQVEGQTNFKVWNEIFSGDDNRNPLPKTSPVLDVTMKSGDVIFIPKGMLHQAIPLSKRVSISFPMMTDSKHKSQDRTWIKL